MYTELTLSNKWDRKCFFVFFAIAICGYLSILTSTHPHFDDYARYINNYSCGTNGRFFTAVLELFIHPSQYVIDATPFTHIISCGILAYTAVICMKMVNATTVSSILCFIPVVVNPFLAECMLFKFDNAFFMLALLLVIIAAYISLTNRSVIHYLWQTALLFCSLGTYQSAFNAYGIIFLYFFIKKICAGYSVCETIKDMKYWIYSAVSATLLYIPILSKIKYCELNGSSFIIPYNATNIREISNNITRYYSDFFQDWTVNCTGVIALGFLFLFCVILIKDNVTSVKKITLTLLLSLIFFTMPYGIHAFTHHTKFNTFVCPRILYTFGIMLSFVMFESYNTLKRYILLSNVSTITMALFALWNISFTNSLGNMHNVQEQLSTNAMMCLSHDINDYNVRIGNKSGYWLYFKNYLSSSALDKFVKLYPIVEKILLPSCGYVCMQNMLLNQTDAQQISVIELPYTTQNLIHYANTSRTPIDLSELDNNITNAELIKSNSIYDLWVMKFCDKPLFCVQFKSSAKTHIIYPVLEIKNNAHFSLTY